MKLSFLIYSYFPYGGQQRDFLRIAERCVIKGYKADVYTLSWQGDAPSNLNVIIVPVKALTNVGLYRKYTSWVFKRLRNKEPSVVIGFNKMPGLDVYFAADPCFLEKAENQRGPLYKFTSRYRHFAEYERAVFGENQTTEIMTLTAQQRQDFEKYYPDSIRRMHDLPPGIDLDRRIEDQRETKRLAFREKFSITKDEIVLLQIGSGFRVKGIDRSLKAVASLPSELRDRVIFILVGKDNPAKVLKLADDLAIRDRLLIVPGSEDIPDFLAGSDLMLHPAYRESAGHVLLEAMVSGLPVLTTSTCGYAWHIEQAKSGLVCAEPFNQDELNQKLSLMIKNEDEISWSENGLKYERENDLYSLHEKAADLIDKFAENIK